MLVPRSPTDGVGQAAVAKGLVIEQKPAGRRDRCARGFEQVGPGGGGQGRAGQAEQLVDGHVGLRCGGRGVWSGPRARVCGDRAVTPTRFRLFV